MAKYGTSATVDGSGNWGPFDAGTFASGSQSVDVVFKRDGVEVDRITRSFTVAASTIAAPANAASVSSPVTFSGTAYTGTGVTAELWDEA